MTNDIDDATPLGDIVATRPDAARVLERFGLDYCCRGERSLGDACATSGIDVREVRDALTGTPTATAEWTDLALGALADEIVATHHSYLWEELPLLGALAAKVLDAHGERHPELHRVLDLVAAVRTDLVPHLLKEERVLFPAVHALESGVRSFPFGTVANPIRTMLTEHDAVGALLAELREVTADYAVPDDGCASYRSLYERLEALEHDTHVHIHKENHVLFPAALAIADR